MARIDALPSIEIIRGFKGILDFYVWRGLPCVRAWPKYRPAKQTAASLATALVFGAIIKSYRLLGDLPLDAYRDDAQDQTRTARDIMVTGAYGNLHEASMSDFLTLLQESRDFLSDLTALLDALHSIDADELMVRTEHSVLPDGASTAAAQATQLTALQKIDDLQDALQSKALDRLLVRGMDQLFTYDGPLSTRLDSTISGANGYSASPSPPDGFIWVVTGISATNRTTATSRHTYMLHSAVGNATFHQQSQAFASQDISEWPGRLYLEHGDDVFVYFIDALAGDTCRVSLIGHVLTKET